MKKQQEYILYILLFIFSFICYRNTLAISFLSDDYSYLFQFHEFGIRSLFHNFGESHLRTLSGLINYAIYACAGMESWPFHAVALAIHTLNAILLFQLVVKYQPFHVASAAAVLFLVLPYQTEAVVWMAASAYLYATFFLLLAANGYAIYLKHRENQKRAWALTLFFLSLLCKEIGLGFIALPLLIEYIIPSSQSNKRLKFQGLMITLGLAIAYASTRYFILGSLVGGYGAEVHLKASLPLLMYNVGCYLAKFFLDYRYIPIVIRVFVKHHHMLSTLVLCIVLALALYKLKHKLHTKSALLILCLFLLSLGPVINLETSFLGDIQSDRYGYLPSLVFVYLVAIGLGTMIQRKLTYYMVISSIGIIYVIQTNITNQAWIKSGQIADNLLAAMAKVQPATQPVYIINLPDNYNGAYTFRCNFPEAVQLHFPSWEHIQVKGLVFQHITNLNVPWITSQQATGSTAATFSLPMNKDETENDFIDVNPKLDLPSPNNPIRKLEVTKTCVKLYMNPQANKSQANNPQDKNNQPRIFIYTGQELIPCPLPTIL